MSLEISHDSCPGGVNRVAERLACASGDGSNFVPPPLNVTCTSPSV